MKSKRSRACDFTIEVKKTIVQRDKGKCLFCRLGKYGKSQCDWIMDIMHYIPRSSGGLGIPENGVLGCRYHHELMDNGNKGYRQWMLDDMRDYLRSQYPEWNENDLYYTKG